MMMMMMVVVVVMTMIVTNDPDSWFKPFTDESYIDV